MNSEQQRSPGRMRRALEGTPRRLVTSYNRMSGEAAATDETRDPPDTDHLIGGAAAGDRHSFSLLVQRYQDTVYRWALVALGDADEAEDVAQLAWIRVYGGLRNYRRIGRFSTWLYVVTRNVIHEHTRMRARRENLLAGETHLDKPPGECEIDVNSIDTRTMVGVVLDFLGRLPRRQREIFQLSELDGFTAAEIAMMLNIEQVTVRTSLLKARRTIRVAMTDRHAKLVEEYQA